MECLLSANSTTKHANIDQYCFNFEFWKFRPLPLFQHVHDDRQGVHASPVTMWDNTPVMFVLVHAPYDFRQDNSWSELNSIFAAMSKALIYGVGIFKRFNLIRNLARNALIINKNFKDDSFRSPVDLYFLQHLHESKPITQSFLCTNDTNIHSYTIKQMELCSTTVNVRKEFRLRKIYWYEVIEASSFGDVVYNASL